LERFLIENVSGRRLAVECLFDKTATPPAPMPAAAPSGQAVPAATAAQPAAVPIDAIATIFGGGEVLQP